MQHRHYDLFLEYFDATIGRYYLPEQRQRLLDLLLGSHGIYRSGDEYKRIARVIANIEGQGINSLTDSKNYKLLCDIRDSEEDVCLAASALVEVHSRKKLGDGGHSMGYLDWIIKLRRANPKTESISMEIAYFEYASGNVKEAIAELCSLVNGGSIVAVHHLAFIYLDSSQYQEAYYYFSLLKSIYSKQLRVPVGEHVEQNVELAREEISTATIREIDGDIEKIGEEFPICKYRSGGTVGFLSTERRFTYEY